MARILVTGGVGWDVPLWLDQPLRSGRRIGARSLPPQGRSDGRSGNLPGRLGGGAANIASALKLAGHDVLIASRVGQDALGQYVFYALHARGLSLDGIRVDAAPTPSLQLLIEPTGERTIIGTRSSAGAPAGWQRWSVAAELVQRFAPDAMILRSPVPAVPSGAGLFAGRLVVAHMPWPFSGPADVPEQRPERVDVAVGSRDDLGDDALAQPLAAAAGFGTVAWSVITAGAGGVRAQSHGQLLTQPAAPATVVDTTGAGDIFMAGLTDALLADAAMPAALAHAAAWAAVAVGIEASAPEPGTPGFHPFTR